MTRETDLRDLGPKATGNLRTPLSIQEEQIGHRSEPTPFKSRFPKAWEHFAQGDWTPWQHYVKAQKGTSGKFYRASYLMLTPTECEQRADTCMHLMDCYGPGGSHHHKKHADEMYSIAQASAISWLSR